MNFEKEMYEVKEKWEESYFNQDDQRRIEFITSLIPADASKLLDVGCGNGILVNYLMKEHSTRFERICATDRSETSLEFVKTEKIFSDINKLPFEDNEFDVVTCLEVIEHLPLKVFENAIRELLRVTSKYLVISVPYNENLEAKKVKCISCATEFSPFYHMHSFVEQDLRSLYKETEASVITVKKIEMIKKPMFPLLKKWISRKINPNAFPKNCICPMCGFNKFDKLKNKNPIRSKTEVKRTGLSKFWLYRNEAKWISAVYKKID